MVRKAGALAALSLATFAYVTTETLPIGLLIPLAHDLHATEPAVGLLVTSYGLVVVLTSIPLTWFTARLPRRPLLAGLLGVFVVATAASSVAPGYPALLAARLLTALSQALFWSIVIPTAAGLFSTRVRGRVLAIVMAGNSLAAVLGVPAGTWLGQQAGWRAAFLALTAVGVLAMTGVAALLPEAPETPVRPGEPVRHGPQGEPRAQVAAGSPRAARSPRRRGSPGAAPATLGRSGTHGRPATHRKPGRPATLGRPDSPPRDVGGAAPDARRYALLIAVTTLAATGAFTAFTFITPFLVEVAGFTAASLGPVLLVRGFAGLAGVTAGGGLADRSPRASIAVPVAVQAAALLALFALPRQPVLATIAVAATGLAFSAFTTALGGRVLHLAPRGADLAAAGSSTAVNVGITAGAFLGGALLPAFGVRSTVLAGALLTLAALAVAATEPLLRPSENAEQSKRPVNAELPASERPVCA